MSRSIHFLALSAFLFLSGGYSVAEEPPKKPGAAPDHQDSAPSPRSHAEVSIDVGGTRRALHIHREDETANRGTGRYYHRPILALEKSPSPRSGYPDVVFDLDTFSDSQGFVILGFKVRLSSPKFRQLCADAVRATRAEADYIASKKGDLAKIDVMRWPITHLVAECKISLTTEILGIGETDSLANTEDEVDVGIKFTPANVARFLRATAANRVQLVFYYTYTGRALAEASTKVHGLQNASLEVEAALTAEQKDGRAPIFQAAREEIAQQVTMRIVAETRLQHKDLFPLIRSQGTDLLAKMMDPVHGLTLADLKTGYPEIEKQMAAYLKPHLETVVKEEAQAAQVVETNEKDSTSTSQVGGGFGIGLGPISLGLSGANVDSRRVLERLQRATGTSFKQVGATERYVPHDITVFRLNSSWRSVSFSDTSTVFLAIGAENRYRADSPVPLVFTADVVEDAATRKVGEILRVSDRSAPVGVVLPFMGQDTAALEATGWMLCDGRPLTKANFEQLFHRIGTLYGTGTARHDVREEAGDFNLPDLRGEFLRGANPTANARTDQITREAGSWQSDALQDHVHTATMEVSGAHRHPPKYHTYGFTYGGHPGGGPALPEFQRSHAIRFIGIKSADVLAPGAWQHAAQQLYTFGGGVAEDTNPDNRINESGAHDHAMTIHGATGQGVRVSGETRPRNRAVHWIIRVN